MYYRQKYYEPTITKFLFRYLFIKCIIIYLLQHHNGWWRTWFFNLVLLCGTAQIWTNEKWEKKKKLKTCNYDDISCILNRLTPSTVKVYRVLSSLPPNNNFMRRHPISSNFLFNASTVITMDKFNCFENYLLFGRRNFHIAFCTRFLYYPIKTFLSAQFHANGN